MIFLNQQDLENIFHEVHFDLHTVNTDTIFFIDDFDKERDSSNLLKESDLFQYLIEPLKKHQPMSYAALQDCQFFLAIKKTSLPLDMSDITKFGVLVNNRAFYIEYSEDCYANNPTFNDLTGVPEFLLNSWLYHTDMWSVAEETTTNIYKSRLPSMLKMPIHSIISDFEKNIDINTEFLTKKFNHDFRKNYEDDIYNDMEKYFRLNILLDTRNTDEFCEKSGYQLFFSSHNDKKEIYITKDADIFTIMKLTNAPEALDNYGAHLFSGAEGEFDFWQYAVDF